MFLVILIAILLVCNPAAAQMRANPLEHPLLLKREQRSIVDDRAFFDLANRWPPDTDRIVRIPVCWENAASNPRANEIVKLAVQNTWELYSSIRFINWSACTRYDTLAIRIEFGDYWPHVRALGKAIGGIVGGMKLNPKWKGCALEESDNCLYKVAVHEFGHALGFAHEQLRKDTPDDCLAEEPPRPGDLRGSDDLGTKWDVQSVMNYCNPTWNNAGALSSMDVLALQRAYGPPRP